MSGAAALVSPGIAVREFDLTTIVPQVSTSVGALAGVFRWGPVGARVLVDSENTLVSRYGYPTNLNPETWFTASNFLSYTGALYISRAGNTAGVATQVSANVVAGSNTVVLTAGNTAALTVGMIAIGSSNGGIANNTTITGITNSTAFAIASSSQALANSFSDTVTFISPTLFSAVGNTTTMVTPANLPSQTIKNNDDFIARAGTFDSNILAVARYPGVMGNSLRISICANSTGYNSSVNLASFGANNIVFNINTNSNSAVVTITAANTAMATANATAFRTSLANSDLIQVGNSAIGTQFLQLVSYGTTNATGNTATFTMNFNTLYTLSGNVQFNSNSSVTGTVQGFNRFWEFYNLIPQIPGLSAYTRNFGNTAINNDEVHVVVVDQLGYFTSLPGTVLEAYRAVSVANDAITLDGTNNFYKTVINNKSQYVYIVNEIPGMSSATAFNLGNTSIRTLSLPLAYGNDGQDEGNLDIGMMMTAYDQFKSKEDVDISIVLGGKSRSTTIQNYIVDNICQPRMDCVLVMSPQYADVVNNVGNEVNSVVATRNAARDTSYAIMDSGYKQIYDRYNDLYRWVPLNGDTAGLMARTDYTNDAWWSPAGFNRGQIKNIVKLAWNPKQAERDVLYKNSVNPVCAFPGQGIILYGDKTLQSKPSAFDRINVRRLFIVLEKAISKASQYTLFEFNDAFTRAQFRNLVTPYLRSVQGRRGIYDFLVVCDETNNTPQVIDSNQFVGDIYIKPARSINFITLNFVAVGTGVSFSEVVGKF